MPSLPVGLPSTRPLPRASVAAWLATVAVLAGCQTPTSGIDSLHPTVQAVGGVVVASGFGFGHEPGAVSIGGVALAEADLIGWAEDEVSFVVPRGAGSGPVHVTARGGPGAASRQRLTVVPRLRATVHASTSGTFVVRAQVLESGGEGVPGVPVHFGSDAGVLDRTAASTGQDGVAQVSLDASRATGLPQVVAHALGTLSVLATYADPTGYDLGVPVLVSAPGGATMTLNAAVGLEGGSPRLNLRTANFRPTTAPVLLAQAADSPAGRGSAAAGESDAPREVIVAFHPALYASAAARTEALASAGVRRLRTFGDLVLVRVPDGEDAEVAARRLAADHRVAYAEPNRGLSVAGLPNDLLLYQQWAPFAVGAPLAWSSGPAYPEVVVAVIDTAIDHLHPDLASALLPGLDMCADETASCASYDEDPHGSGTGAMHGTHVAGIVAAAAGGGYGTVGGAPGVRLLPVKVFPADVDSASTLNVALAVRWASGLPVGDLPPNPHPAHVINLSLGGAFTSRTLQDAISAARSAGVVVIAATGNDGASEVNFPAAADGVIGVGAVEPSLRIADFSNRGVGSFGPGGVDLLGPGVDVLSSAPGGLALRSSGTSMAAPLVSAAAATLFAREPGMSPDAVESALKASAYCDAACRAAPEVYGAGVVRLDGASGLVAPTSESNVALSVEVSWPTGSASGELDLLSGETGWLSLTGAGAGQVVAIDVTAGGVVYSGSLALD